MTSRRRSANRRPEQAIHRAVVQHLRQRGAPGLVFVHPANGGSRRPIEAAIFKSLGVRAGASDLLLWHDGKSFALELKPPGGRATDAQLEFLSDMEKAGAFTCLCEGLDRALHVLESWGLLRTSATQTQLNRFAELLGAPRRPRSETASPWTAEKKD